MSNPSPGTAGRVARAAWRGWRRLAQSLLGAWDWEAPPWSRWLGHGALRAGQTMANGARRHPMAAAAASLASIALAAGALAAWHWYQHRPLPQYASFSVTSPARTRIEDEAAKPDPLIVRFDRSASALVSAGKEVRNGVVLEPDIAGTWRWVDDRILEFQPVADWPIGQAVAVKLDRSLFGPQIRLASYEFKFSTAPFTARIVNTELYQDPINPGIKQAVFDVQFSHPVDPSDFERHVELRLAGQSRGLLGVGRETTEFKVVYDKWRLNAAIHSAALPIPKDATELRMQIASGLRAGRGGNRLPALGTGVRVPGLYSLSVTGLDTLVVDNERDEPEQILLLGLSAASGERDVARAVSAWVLPTIRPAEGVSPPAGREDDPYRWHDISEVTGDLLRKADSLPLEQVPAEREFVEKHSFRYHADVGRYLFVQVERNLRSFGGYLSPATERFIVRVPPFPPQLRLLSRGSLLALSGDRKVLVLVRDLPGASVDIGRVLPDQLQHLVSQSEGDFSNPVFGANFGSDNLVERFVRKIPLGATAHGHAHYEPIDLGAYLRSDGRDRRGLFLLTVRGYDPVAEARRRQAVARESAARERPHAGVSAAPDEAYADAPADGDQSDLTDDGFNAAPETMVDQRLVLVTDIGIIVKKSSDGALDVFLQSIESGEPIGAAIVEIIAKNGTTLFTQTSDPSGRAHFASLAGLVRERAPLFIQVRKAGDLSFLPLNRADRTLDYSRFDVGGMRNARNASEISAYLFSDRGVYRPGETLHVGMIVKATDWSVGLSGLPLEYAVIDSRGLAVKRERLKLGAGGFAEMTCETAAASPSGTYTVNLFIVKDNAPEGLIGTTSVRVQEFEPDRMKVAAQLSAQATEGWVSPKELKALVNVQNLFGTPAEHRRVEATLTLTPAFPAFRAFPDYRFYDPQRAKEGYADKLRDASTDSTGNAAFELGLDKYAKATYRVHVLARAFEAESGRSVAADTAALVSDLPILIGYKADGDLRYVARGSSRLVSWLAIDCTAKPADAPALRIVRIETRYVSVLTRQVNGTYKYESRMKETTLSDDPFALRAGGVTLPLATENPGSYAYSVRDASGLELNRVQYSVAGRGNVTRSLDRSAELQIALDRKDYSPGDDIEISIKAPYTGAGLITIERDRVYATRWFKSDTTSSVQRIRLPEDFSGNGYVSVQFVRDPASDEIFTSPMSFGVVPFMTSLSTRVNALELQAPALVKPGEELRLKLRSSHPSRVVVFAVDEGILQVAQYRAPDPLGEFFKKRALEVSTAQILDLVLPEFKRIMAAAAPGGDGDAALRRNLNPFKRKTDKPAAYWSGIVDIERTREFTWKVPDSFNGTLKVFAVSVDDLSIGVAQTDTLVRGDFVLTPNMPAAVAPGDEFEVSVGVANNVAGSDGADVAISVQLPPQIEAVGPTVSTLAIGAMRESVAVFRFRARAQPGSASITFAASWRAHAARLVGSLSVRPASPYSTEIMTGFFGASADIAVPRALYPDHRKLNISVSALPLGLAAGLTDYLEEYPHLCTEQLVSRGFAALVAGRRPQLAESAASEAKAGAATAALIRVLRNRQNAEGGFGLWTASVNADEFASVYAAHWLIEAREHGEAVPDDLLQSTLVWLQRYAASPVRDDVSPDLWELRNRAYAAYLLTRRGMLATPIIASLRETLDARHPRDWKTDATAAYMAAAYELQKQDREAHALMDHLRAQIGGTGDARPAGRYGHYDDTARDAQILYLMSRHFPSVAHALPATALQSLLAPLNRGNYNTLFSAYLVLALDAYAASLPNQGLDKFTATQSLAEGPASEADEQSSGARARLKSRTAPLDLRGTLILRAAYEADARSLHLDNDTGMTGFYAVTNAGFDVAPPKEALSQGMEIFREYLDDAGRPVRSGKIGDVVTVRLRLRAIDADDIPDIAVIDLLPGGFEPVRQPAAPGAWQPVFADVREDRVLLYGSLSQDLAEYQYRIRATNAGIFLAPPCYAESMYDRRLRARAPSGSITVAQPPGK